MSATLPKCPDCGSFQTEVEPGLWLCKRPHVSDARLAWRLYVLVQEKGDEGEDVLVSQCRVCRGDYKHDPTCPVPLIEERLTANRASDGMCPTKHCTLLQDHLGPCLAESSGEPEPGAWLCVCYDGGVEVPAMNLASTRKEDVEAQRRYWHEPHKGKIAEIVTLYRGRTSSSSTDEEARDDGLR